MKTKIIWRGYGKPGPEIGRIPGSEDKFWRWCVISMPHPEDARWVEYVYSNSPLIFLERLGLPPESESEEDALALLEDLHGAGIIRLLEHYTYREPPF